MLREGLTWALRNVVKTAARVPPVRQGLHHLSVATRGAGIAFLRCRRLLPDTAAGRAHPDRIRGSATTPKELKSALLAARKTLRFVHIGEALSVLSRGTRLREGLAVLTFDESFAYSAELAEPIMKELGIPATLFVTTGPLDDTTTTLWDSDVHAVIAALAPHPVQVGFVDRSLPTSTAKERQDTAHRLLLSLTSLDETELQARLEELFALVGGRPAVSDLDRMVGAAALQKIAREPLWSVGAHGHGHLSLATASDEALLDELLQPRARLQELCGNSFVDVVSYPFGRPPYVDERVVKAARAAGYRAGFTATSGVARPGDHLFQLPRLAVDRSNTGIQGYQLAGTLNAVDELVLVATGEQQRLEENPEG